MSNESMANYVTDTPSDIAELLAEIKALEAKNGELEKKLEIAESEWKAYYNSSVALSKKLEIVSKQFIRMHEIACKGYKYYDDETEQALAAINGEGV